MAESKGPYALRRGRVPFTRRLLEAMLRELGVESKVPPSRFYSKKPLYADGIPPELLGRAVPLERLKRALNEEARRINLGFWALNRTLLRRHGLRAVSYRLGEEWYRQFVPLEEALPRVDETLSLYPEDMARRVSEAQFLATSRYQDDLQRRAKETVAEQNEIAALQAYWAAQLKLPAIVIERLELRRKEIIVRELPPGKEEK